MTTAQQLRDEGRQQGRQEGRQEGRLAGQQRILINQLRLKFGEQADAFTAAIENMNETELDNAAAGILTAESLDQLFK